MLSDRLSDPYQSHELQILSCSILVYIKSSTSSSSVKKQNVETHSVNDGSLLALLLPEELVAVLTGQP